MEVTLKTEITLPVVLLNGNTGEMVLANCLQYKGRLYGIFIPQYVIEEINEGKEDVFLNHRVCEIKDISINIDKTFEIDSIVEVPEKELSKITKLPLYNKIIRKIKETENILSHIHCSANIVA